MTQGIGSEFMQKTRHAHLVLPDQQRGLPQPPIACRPEEVGQNLYLGAEAIGAGACAVAAFDDEAINNVLGLDGESEFLIYVAAVGKRVVNQTGD